MESPIATLNALLNPRQVCCDPRRAKTEVAAKLGQRMQTLAEGRRIVLRSPLISMLSLIADGLRNNQRSWAKLSGQTQKRAEAINRFTSDEAPIPLISLKAGGVSPNLPQG